MIRYPISKDDNKRYTYRAYVLPNHGFMAKFTVRGMSFLLWWAFNQRVAGYSHSIGTIIACMLISCLPGHNYSSPGSQLGKIIKISHQQLYSTLQYYES